MCGRFTLTVDTADLQDAFAGFEFPANIAPRYNVAPSQPVLVLPNDGTGRADFFNWGLIPSWAKDPTIGARMINARAETLAEKPSFRGPYRYKRCLIPADGFYEWKKEPGQSAKTPYRITLKDRGPFAFAGLWDEWLSPDGSQVKSCVIITTAPNSLVAQIHDRMPVILHPQDYAAWLAPQAIQPQELQSLLTAFPAEAMSAYPVSRLVNNAKGDSPEMIKPQQNTIL
jgi:putative SOS response-associated peptidase YedK